MRAKKWFAAATATVFVLGVAACGDDTTESSSGDTASSADKPEIKLVANAWTASALDAQIAKQLIEKELGNKVSIVDIDENTMFAGLSKGDLDAVLEIWPSGITEDEQAFFDDKSVTNIGELGAVGKIGWWVPDYVLEKYPELKTWEGFKDPKVAKAFASAETGDKGRFLGTDPSYSQYDESIISKLDLPLQVVFSGSEPATAAELDAKVAAKEPIVMYWWTPTAAVAKYNLKNVELPKHTEDCYKDLTAVACDYPEDPLFKAASSKLKEKDAKVFDLLSKMQLTNDDQLALLPRVEIDKEDADKVAADWIKDNESVWKAWLA